MQFWSKRSRLLSGKIDFAKNLPRKKHFVHIINRGWWKIGKKKHQMNDVRARVRYLAMASELTRTKIKSSRVYMCTNIPWLIYKTKWLVRCFASGGSNTCLCHRRFSSVPASAVHVSVKIYVGQWIMSKILICRRLLWQCGLLLQAHILKRAKHKKHQYFCTQIKKIL